jgi:murein DD-endopeptidase MepM/ murein hydrolase activator NlpD
MLLKEIKITSPYEIGRVLPYVNGGKPLDHKAVDFRAILGTEIYAPEKIRIKRTGYNPNGWKEGYVVADGLESGYELKFIHVAAKCSPGETIERNGLVAVSDGSGTTDGRGGKAPHLHFEVWQGESWKGGHPVNPMENGYFGTYIQV